MIKNLNALFIAISDNKAVVFDTNLKNMWDKLKAIEPDCRNYDYYYREFKKKSIVVYINPDDKIYVLQRLEP